jgi:nitrogen-specific signal transduction histidine kinase
MGEPGQKERQNTGAVPQRHQPFSGLILVDLERGTTACTPELERLFGKPAGGTQERFLSELPPVLVQLAKEASIGHRSVFHSPVNLRTAAAEPARFSVHASALPGSGPGKQVVLMLGNLDAQPDWPAPGPGAEPSESQATTLASLAHEIKNALVAVKTFVELLLEKNRDSELAEVVHKEMGRIDGLLARMLRSPAPPSRSSTGVRLHDILEESLRVIQPQLAQKAAVLNRRFQAKADRVDGDANELQQAFLNLFLNSIDALDRAGTLTVSTENPPPPAAQILVSVSDSGAGIPAEVLNRIFDPFFTTKPQGTGLGLTVTQRIFKEHGGSVEVVSEPGQGTTFRIGLPLFSAPA